MKRHFVVIATVVSLFALAGAEPGRAASPTPGPASPASHPAAPAGPQAGFKEIKWEDLVPKGWDPLKRFRGKKLSMLNDGDPRIQELLNEMREVWDSAPTKSSMNGAAVKLPGYIVPIEESKEELREFLLVPYFGACIHSPPPPANQIVHVFATKPVKGFKMMDTVWVSGTMTTVRQDSDMGVSGYQMQAVVVDRYVPPKR